VQLKQATIALTFAAAAVACTTAPTGTPSADAPSTHLNLDDVVFFYVKLTWANAETPQGYRLIEWRWMKGEQVVATTTTKYLFQSAPRDIRTRISASTLGEGVFTVAAYMDGSLLDKGSFTINGRTSSTGPQPAAQVAAC
jgi:hypothetical protein